MNQNFKANIAAKDSESAPIKRPSICDIAKENAKIIDEIETHLGYTKNSVEIPDEGETNCGISADPNSLMEDLMQQQRRLMGLLLLSRQLRESICGA